ncbi:MAG: hypothetical protein HZA91_11745 [Verrucomicrobia bacterium]|nr:hypothetical protein [Verrucomicrobiota bacterium]
MSQWAGCFLSEPLVNENKPNEDQVMNEPNSNPMPKPPPLPPVVGGPPSLGELPTEREPIHGFMAAVEAILREPRRVMFQLSRPGAASVIAVLLLSAIVCALVYGVVVGTFSGGVQLWTAPVKIAAGLMLSTAICLPSLYIFACLSGSRARLVDVCGLVAGLLALATMLLVGFAPVAWIFSQSTESDAAMGAMHLGFWSVASYFGMRFMNTGFAHLDARASGGLKTWLVVFMLVVLQMTTALRPIVGTAPTLLSSEKKFFLGHWMDCMEGKPRPAPTTNRQGRKLQ